MYLGVAFRPMCMHALGNCVMGNVFSVWGCIQGDLCCIQVLSLIFSRILGCITGSSKPITVLRAKTLKTNIVQRMVITGGFWAAARGFRLQPQISRPRSCICAF